MTLHSSGVKTIKREQVCFYCGNFIEGGTSGVHRETYRFKNTTTYRYICPHCAPLLEEFEDYIDVIKQNAWDDWQIFLKNCHPGLLPDDEGGDCDE